MAGVIFAICIIIWAIRSYSGGSGGSGTTSDAKPNQYGYVLVVWFPTLIAISYLGRMGPIPITIFLLLFSPVLFPALISTLTSKLGWVDASFYIGRISFFIHGRNPLAVGIYKSYIAASKKDNDEERKESLIRVMSFLQSSKGKIFSGEMVMYIILEAMLSKPRDNGYLAYRLKLLKGLGRASIPSCVSKLAFRLELSSVLPRNDWDEIYDIADRWDTDAVNGLALWVKEFYGCYIVESRNYSKLKCWLYSLIFAFGSPLKSVFNKRLLEHQGEFENFDQKSSPLKILWKRKHGTLDEKERKRLKGALLSSQSKQIYEARAKQLGVNNFERTWKSIEESVDRYPGLCERETFGPIEDEKRFIHINSQHKNLRYIESSIQKKLSRKKSVSGFEHYMDWLRVLEIVHDLKTDKYEQLAAFSNIHGVIWNWVAELWNDRKEHSLVHFIATICAPLAYEAGQKEFANMLSGITLAEYK